MKNQLIFAVPATILVLGEVLCWLASVSTQTEVGRNGQTKTWAVDSSTFNMIKN